MCAYHSLIRVILVIVDVVFVLFNQIQYKGFIPTSHGYMKDLSFFPYIGVIVGFAILSGSLKKNLWKLEIKLIRILECWTDFNGIYTDID